MSKPGHQDFQPVDVSPAGLHVVGSPPWVRGVVRRLHPDARVTQCAVESMEVGTTTRMRIRVEHTGPATLPGGWFVKLPSLDWRARLIAAVPALLAHEVRWYRQVAPRVPVKVPRCLAAGQSWRGDVLVLEDVDYAGAVARVPGDALTVEQTAAVLRTLAELHAGFRESPLLTGSLAWLGEARWQREARAGNWLAGPLMRRSLRVCAGLLDDDLARGMLHYARRRRAMTRELRRGPATLVHYDVHPGNVYFDGDEAGLFDWQMARVGPGIGDVAYLLSTALQPADRRASERDLVAEYAGRLAAAGVPETNATGLFERYQMHIAYPLEAMLLTAGIGGLAPSDAALTCVARAAAAAADNDSLARLRSSTG